MFPTATILTALLPVICVAASPQTQIHSRSLGVAIPFTKRISTNGGAIHLVRQNQARIAALKEHGTAIQNGELNHRISDSLGIAAYSPSSAYVASVGIGSPPVAYNLLIELSGANTWIGNNKPYTPTSVSKDTGEPVGVVYLPDSYWNGEEWLDTVDLGSGLVISNQSIGVASSSYGYAAGVDGMLGLGPTFLTVGTLWNQLDVVFPTVTDNLYDQGTIPVDAFSLYLAPITGSTGIEGELTFGGTDSSKYTGEINYVPITTTKPASYFWGIDHSISYGGKTILKQTAGVIDAACPLILIASDAYSAYKNATGSTEDKATQMLKLTFAQYDNLESLNFHIGSATFTLPPNGQIWPRTLNSYVGGSNGAIYSIITNAGAPSGSGLDFTLGQPFLERFYSVFDTTRQRIGFATTSHTDATSN